MGLLNIFGGGDSLIYIHTDRQQYHSGDLVTGQVVLSLLTAIHVDAIYVKLSGLERTEMDVSRQKDNKVYMEHVSDSRSFFRRRFCLLHEKCTLSEGNFVFPFQFTLDKNLPGSFSMARNRGGHERGEVTYCIEAEVAKKGIFVPNLRHSQEIIICEPLRQLLCAVDTLKEAKVTYLCCIPKGRVSMSASIDKNAYGPGDVVQLRLIVDNSESQVDLERLSLRLMQSFTMRAGRDSTSGSACICMAHSPAVPQGERADRLISMPIPARIEPSTSGRLIECEYRLTVTLAVPWSLDVVIRVPVQIATPQQSSYLEALPTPPEWSPSVFPLANMNEMAYVSY